MSDPEKLLLAEMYLTDEQLKAVGCLALEAAMLEDSIEDAIRDCCPEAVAELLLKGRMLEAKTHVLKAVAKPFALSVKHAEEFEQLFGEITNDIPKRNTVIHGEWNAKMTLSDMAAFRRSDNAVATRKAAKSTSEQVKATEVMDLAHKFSEYRARLYGWMKDIPIFDQKATERIQKALQKIRDERDARLPRI